MQSKAESWIAVSILIAIGLVLYALEKLAYKQKR